MQTLSRLDSLLLNMIQRRHESNGKKVQDLLPIKSGIHLVADFKNEDASSEYPEVDGINVLGVMSGIFFVPDGTSVNNRYYPLEFWVEVLKNPELQDRLNGRLMFGTIGHEDKYIDDMDLRNGIVSHIVTKLWIDPKTKLGMGEALILGTDTGKNLYKYLKAKSDIKISSRAYGDYIPNKLYNGIPIMDAKTYRLEGFDVVLFPGFTQTKLSVHESTDANIARNKLIVESVIKRRSEIMAATKQNPKSSSSEGSLTDELRRSRCKAESQVTALEKKISELNSKLEEVTKERDTWKDEGSKLLASYRKYNGLGTVSDITAKIEKLGKYEAIAEDPEELKAVMSEATDRINKGKELMAMMEDASGAFDANEDVINQYFALVGSIPEARRNKIKMERALKQYTSFGTISEIQAMHEKCKAMEQKIEADRMKQECRKYSVLSGQTIETVQKIFESAKSREDALKVLDSMKISQPEKVEETKNESTQRKPLRTVSFKKESVIDDKNNSVLAAKHESQESDTDIEISKHILRKFIKY